jgi:histidine ammonia-lyase
MSKKVYQISPEKLTFKAIFDILKQNWQLALSDEAIRRIVKCRAYLDKKTESGADPI